MAESYGVRLEFAYENPRASGTVVLARKDTRAFNFLLEGRQNGSDLTAIINDCKVEFYVSTVAELSDENGYICHEFELNIMWNRC